MSDVTVNINPYQSPHEAHGIGPSIPLPDEPTDFRAWRKYLAFHLVVVLATFAAAMMNTGYWKLPNINAGALGPVLGLAIGTLMYVGLFQMAFVSPIVILLLFYGTFARDNRYLLAAIMELLLTGAYFVIATPMCQ